MGTYSFLDVQASISGPGGNFSIGSSAGVAEEGITVAMIEDKNTMTIGADGEGMNSLHGGNAGSLTLRLLKTSPVNAQLMTMYNSQKASSATWGQNVLVVSDTIRGDVVSATGCSFKKIPDLTYAKEGGMNEWTFDAIRVNEILGTGVPDVNV